MEKKTLKEKLQEVNWIVFTLVCTFALSSWIDLYGVYVEMPLLVQYLPEGWSLPSYSGVITCIANIGPLIYAISALVCPGKAELRETFTIYFIIISGAVTCIFMAFFWDHTAFVLGAERSVALFIMIFFLSLVDCTSCVVFLPFMSRFKASYMPAYIAGEEMGGMISGLVGLVQGVAEETQCINVTREIFNQTANTTQNVTEIEALMSPPRFSVSAFFLFLFSVMCLSVISFSLLNYSKYCQKEMTGEEENVHGEKDVMLQEIKTREEIKETPIQASSRNSDTRSQEQRFRVLVFYFAYSAFFMYGLLPACLSFAIIPYGYFEYNLSLRLSTVINPIVALSTFVFETSSIVVISVCILLANLLSAFCIYLAAMSPYPPLAETTAGSFMVVIVSISTTSLYSFARTSTAILMRKEAGHRGLLWAGFVVQIGAFLGTVLGFILVNVLEVFEEKQQCP